MIYPPGTVVGTPKGLGRVLGRANHTPLGWAFLYYDQLIGAVALLSAKYDGPFLAVQVGREVHAVAADDVERVKPNTLGPLERIWFSVWEDQAR